MRNPYRLDITPHTPIPQDCSTCRAHAPDRARRPRPWIGALLFLLLLFPASFSPLLAIDPCSDFPYLFKHPQNASALPAESTRCIIQDHQGFILIGTEKGVYRLEGNTHRHLFSLPERHKDTPISALCQDHEHYVWIGTPGYGLFRLDPQTGTYAVFKTDPQNEESVASDTISQIYLDGNQRLWIGTADAGLCQFVFQTGTFIRYSPQSPPSRRLPIVKIGPIIADKSGNLFVGSDDQGIYCLPVKRQEFLALPSGNDLLIRNLSISALFVDARDTLWIGTRERGLYQLGGPWSPDKQVKFIPLTAQYFQSAGFRWDINALHESPFTPNQLWIGSNNGLFLFNRENGHTLHAYHNRHLDSLNGNQILSLLEDRGGTLWIGIDFGKYDRIALRSRFFTTHKAGPASGAISQNHISALFRLAGDPTRLLLGAVDGSLTLAGMNRDGQLSFPPPIAGPTAGIRQFANSEEQPERVFCLSQQNELWKYDIPTGRCSRVKIRGLNAKIHSIMSLSSLSAILLGCDRGLYLYHPDQEPERELEIFQHCADFSIRLLQKDNQGGMYLACEDGFYHLDSPALSAVPSRFTFKLSKEADSQLSAKPQIEAILCRYNGEVVLASRHHGLLRINGQNIEAIAPLPYQSPASPIFGLFEDDLLQMWVCAREGLFMLSASAKNYDDWTLLDERHQIPMPLNGAGLFDSQTNQLFLASAQGLLQINLRDLILPSPSNISLISMTAIDQKNRQIMNLIPSDTTPIRIPWRYNSLELSFAVHDHFAPEKTRISYRLFGRDRDWRFTREGEQTVRYQRIAPGSYTLYVNGLNAHRQRGGSGLIFYFDFTVPLLKRPLFWLFSLFLLFLTFFLIRTLRRRFRSSPDRGKPLPKLSGPQSDDDWAQDHNMSEREMEIINLILSGKSNKEIEEALFISIKTVKSHIYNIYKKAGVKSRYELISRFSTRENGRINSAGDEE